MKIRFIEPGNRPYKKSVHNYFDYDRYEKSPSNEILTLAAILKKEFDDVLCYCEAISKILWKDVFDADIVFITIFTFNANRGYELAKYIKQNSKALVVFTGLHATLNYEEAAKHCDYVLRGEGDELIVQFTKAVSENREIDMPGIAYAEKNGDIITTGEPLTPHNFDTVPDRNLVYRFKEMTKYNALWPQVRGSRGCPHSCDYCAVTAAYGTSVRTRSPQSVVQDIKEAIAFFGENSRGKMLRITDDNFFADRNWAVCVLKAIIKSKIKYPFTIQARYEIGYDDELLDLLKKAGFEEISIGIEFLEDESLKNHSRKGTLVEIMCAVKRIQSKGIRVRGMFILGDDNETKGVGKRLAKFVIKNNLSGALIQSMYFIPGTPVYESHKQYLIDKEGDWSRFTGRVVHLPKNMTPSQLQREIIAASRKIYSRIRLFKAIFTKEGIERTLFIGEYFRQKSLRKDLKKELDYLESAEW